MCSSDSHSAPPLTFPPSDMNTRPLPKPTARAGFSLMELMIVLLILVTIAGIAVPRFSSVSDRSNDARRISDMVAVEKALEMYKADHGTYPKVKSWQGDAPNYGGHGYDKNGYIPGLVPDYIQRLPRDPDPEYPDGSKGYLYRSNGQDFKFIAHKTPTSFPKDHRFYDPKRKKYAYQVSSPGGLNW